MELNLSDYKDQRKQVSEDQRKQAKIIVQQAVNANFLTTNEYWNDYLSYLQDAIDRTVEALDSFDARLTDPSVTNPDELMKAKIGRCECQARIDSWKAAMSLPGDLMAGGETARKWLDEIGPG